MLAGWFTITEPKLEPAAKAHTAAGELLPPPAAVELPPEVASFVNLMKAMRAEVRAMRTPASKIG